MQNACFTSLCAAIILAGLAGCGDTRTRPPIKVGILHSMTGTMAISEKSVIDSTLMAIDELNEKGGVLGRRLEAVVVDGRSDPAAFAEGAERLITQDGVSVVFGCWTSASRKTVKPLFEKHNHLLFYPVQYEGLEQSPHIIYTGAVPNQQLLPAVNWCFHERNARKFFLIGSDYVFPRAAHAIMRAAIEKLGGQVVGDDYVLLGSSDFRDAVAKIIATQPDVVLNCINGDGNVAFFEELHAAEEISKNMFVVSLSMAEDELRSMGLSTMVGNYCAWNYFQSIDRSENRDYVARFKARYGRQRVTDDPMEAAYCGVHLWAQAAQRAGTDAPSQVRKALADVEFMAPEGLVRIDPATQHMLKVARIGKIRSDGQFDIVWTSPRPIPPQPFPEFRSREEWDRFLQNLYEGWGQHWAPSTR